MRKLDKLNRANDEQAAAMLAPVIERAPEIARRVARRRPFASTDELRQAIHTALRELDEPQRIRLFRAHPELAPENPLAMTEESQSEQARLSLTSAENAFRTRLNELNARYSEKFGFPFITALVRHPDLNSVIGEFEARLAADRASELDAAVEQIATVSATRVRALFGDRSGEEAQSAASCAIGGS